ncbi:hypothetical protein B4135_0607 [Caldibacillus debilis]|uniref:Uncharacterized protein n=1 Tax=Caldibacillus debilis TaxID=301148 RepID=A0A150MF22_9BACI|nr:hypothetical protein B4135_0607 [Caldibacillus debilis]
MSRRKRAAANGIRLSASSSYLADENRLFPCGFCCLGSAAAMERRAAFCARTSTRLAARAG